MITLSVVNSGEHWNSLIALDALLTETCRAGPRFQAWGQAAE